MKGPRAGPGTVLLALGLVVGGCAGREGPILPPELAGGEAPWAFPEGSAPTQRLFRARYEGREADGDFRLTVLLTTPESYRIVASGGLPSRALWELAVTDRGDALWLDRREKLYCWVAEARDLRLPDLANLSVDSIPRVLLGRIPGVPEGRVARADDGRISYTDGSGRRWDAGLGPDGGVSWWALILDDSTRAFWKRRDDGSALLVDQVGGHELSWEEAVREAYDGPPVGLEIPAGFVEGDCAQPTPAGT